jgi:UDP-2,4-diacetamido-2,4,6-trideoxy-beta-L-altropyranose hydrolase
MLQADWALCAGGATTWERLCLGLPGLIIGVADNQIALSQAVALEGKAQVFLGISERLKSGIQHIERVTPDLLKAALLQYLQDDSARNLMACAGLDLVDGMGARRLADLMRATVAASRL